MRQYLWTLLEVGMLSKKPVTGTQRLMAMAMPIAVVTALYLIRTLVLWLAISLAISPWVETKASFWSALGLVILLFQVKEIFSDKE